MKIVFINSCEYMGGAELWHLRTALAFRKRGHHVSMILRRGPLADRSREQGLSVVILPMAFDLDLYSCLKALWYFRREKPDLVLLNDQRECRVIAPAAAMAGIRVRVQRKGWPYLKGSWRDRMVYRRFVTHLIANSDAIARIFRSRSGLAPDRIRVFPNGIDVERFGKGEGAAFRERIGVSESDALIGAAGRLVTQKGFDTLVKALGSLLEDGVELKACIAGNGPERERLEALAQEAGVADRLIFPGHVDDMPSFLAGLDLFAFPSRMEGRSNALAEAMAAGLPVIATDIPGNDELIAHEKTGILVPPEDPGACARAIKRLLEDREPAERLGSAAREYVEVNMDSEKILDELEAYLESLTGKY
jgi:glycosyltransferase involved in cell wall biosynthesis